MYMTYQFVQIVVHFDKFMKKTHYYVLCFFLCITSEIYLPEFGFHILFGGCSGLRIFYFKPINQFFFHLFQIVYTETQKHLCFSDRNKADRNFNG